MPPLKTGYLTAFEKGQIFVLRKKEVVFLKLESFYTMLKVLF